jgi:hypothetical protein
MHTVKCMMAICVAAGLVACTSNSGEKNYKLLEEDRPRFETEHRPMGRGDGGDVLQWASIADDLEVMVETAPPPTGGRAGSVIPTTFEDRSAWNVITIAPADGRTTHWPVYFRDCPTQSQRIAPMTAEAAFELHLAGDAAAGWSASNAADTVTQPLKFAFDLVTLPVQLILSPPLVNHTSP